MRDVYIDKQCVDPPSTSWTSQRTRDLREVFDYKKTFPSKAKTEGYSLSPNLAARIERKVAKRLIGCNCFISIYRYTLLPIQIKIPVCQCSSEFSATMLLTVPMRHSYVASAGFRFR